MGGPRDVLAVQPLDEQVGGVLLLAGPRVGKEPGQNLAHNVRRVRKGALQGVNVWSRQHALPWRNWMARPSGRCERDEWPPAHFWQDRGAGQLIRYNHKEANNDGGKIWGNFCPDQAVSSCLAGSERDITPNRGAITRECRKDLTLKGTSTLKLK